MARKELVEIYVPVVYEVNEFDPNNIPMGLKKSDIVWKNYGRTTYPCIVQMGTLEEKKAYERVYDSSLKAKRREHRCQVPDGKGGFIRCPESNRCHYCGCWLRDEDTGKYYMCERSEKCITCDHRQEFSSNRPLSLERLTVPEEEGDKVIEIADSFDSEADSVGLAVLKELIDYLTSFGEGYEVIFKLLYENIKIKDMADEYGVAWSTMKDKVKKVREIAKEFLEYTDK